MKRTALLIIDMQNDFVRAGAPLQVAQAQAVIPNIRTVLQQFRERNLPVFHVLRVHRADGSDVEIIRQALFRDQPFTVEGTRGAAEVEELHPLPGEYVIRKTRMSAFLGTELDLMLRNLKVTGLVVTGIQTPNCIRTTVLMRSPSTTRWFLSRMRLGRRTLRSMRQTCWTWPTLASVL